MPSKNTVKQFIAHGVYHVYNRGVAKQPIFHDSQDYDAYLRRIQLVLSPLEEAEKIQKTNQRIRLNNMHGEVFLQAFCLMPNHFHLLLRQGEDSSAISRFISTINTSYSMYFNRKYDRVGPVFRGRFKAAHVDNDIYYTHLSRYIHCNPAPLGVDIATYPYSSQQFYFENAPSWIETNILEGMFDSKQQYRSFINDLKDLQAASEEYDL